MLRHCVDWHQTLEKEIARLEKDLPRIEGKLNNPKFVDKAPATVIEKEKEKLANIQLSLVCCIAFSQTSDRRNSA
jgi:valyl-tRNA synthetase